MHNEDIIQRASVMYENRDTHISHKDFRDLSPVTARVIRSIEKVMDQDDPDRVAIKKSMRLEGLLHQ